MNTEHHPWIDMTDEEMLRSCGLILEDPETNQEGITLAAVLLFGTNNRIMSVLPQHKTDAIFRVFNVDRYDDRDVVITNLIESYDRLMEFGKKHLNDVFTLDGVQRISARDKILREIISNLLMHR
ncbi:AAA family ATPase, partial [Gardnerella swidsinskii]